MGEHATASRELDESLTGLRQALMVASEATPARNPGKGTFDDPPLGQDSEASLGLLDLRLGFDQLLIASGPQTTHGLNVPPQMLFDPFNQCPPVMTITPDQRHPGKETFQWLKQLFASR